MNVRLIRAVLLTSVLAAVSPAFATTYTVNRAWTAGANTGSLIGTVTIPEGTYTITNGSPTPFTGVSLTMVLNGGSPETLDEANYASIAGTGEFHIDATPTQLIFDTANGNGSNPADLAFRDSTSGGTIRYAIGFDGSPGFEVGITPDLSVAAFVDFPEVFAVAVPEPTCLMLTGTGFGALMLRRRRTVTA